MYLYLIAAIAELLDNAVDEINNGATFVKVDRVYSKRDNSPALLFLDDGGGMDPDGIRKCMSLGYSTKKTNNTIGQYGNGFKTSTMRLGADVIVFSRANRNGRATQSVGLLSYTFLRRTGQDDVIVPMFEDIGSHGTKIIIFNLWLNDEGIYELNFDEDEEDIKLRDESARLTKLSKRTADTHAHISYRLLHSLRAYASLLYLRKFNNFKIILRGKPVEQYVIADDLKFRKVAIYKPHVSSAGQAVAETTLGFIKEAPAIGITGFNVYHKNRLIRPYWKVTGEGHSKGYGIVGVLEANFIEPAHDKQDFERSSVFSRLEMKLNRLQMEYWKEHCHLIGHQPDPTYLRRLEKASSVPLQTQGEPLHHTIPGRAVGPRPDLSGSQIHGRTNYNNDMPMVRPPPGFQTGLDQEVACAGDGSRGIDEICDENIELFMRCEQYMQRETELKSTVSDLEKEVADTKRKCAELSSRLELLRKQKLVR
ncbi:putative histidine kinase/HSP90-like ATPase superfamily, morc, S5 domain 2 [Helianthus annuus]|nr:putative histidine kinase/HSP90-like ATPase superfamily, morc, S5 domain 2 [Helianthus annuus]